MPVKPGDHVVFPGLGGVWVEVEEERLLVCRVGQLLGVLEGSRSPARAPCGRSRRRTPGRDALAAASSTTGTPKGTLARCSPWPSGSPYRQGLPSGSRWRRSTCISVCERSGRTGAQRSCSETSEGHGGVQLPGLTELGERPVDRPRLLTDVLEQQQATLRLELPRRPQGGAEDPVVPPVSGARASRHDRDHRGGTWTLWRRPLSASRKAEAVCQLAVPCVTSIGPQTHDAPAAASGTSRWVMSDMPISGLPPAAIRSRSRSGSS